MYSANIEPFEVAAAIEQERKVAAPASIDDVAGSSSESSSAPLLDRPNSRPSLQRRSSFSALLDSVRLGVDSVRLGVDSMTEGVKARFDSVRTGVAQQVSQQAQKVTGKAGEAKQWTQDVKQSIQQLMGAPDSLVCGGCKRELAIPASAFKWECTKGHENDFIEPNCNHQDQALAGVDDRLLACGEARPADLEWPKVQCPFPSCSHITPIPRTQAAAILKAGVSTLSTSVSALTHPPSAMFHCGTCNCLLAMPTGPWQCQACTEVCSDNDDACKKCGQHKNQQKLLCGLCKHSTSIPSSAFSDSIRSSLKAVKEQARKMAFTAIGQPFIECPYCAFGQPVTEELLGLKDGKGSRRGSMEKESAKDAKFESNSEARIGLSSADSVTSAPTSADADLLLATATVPLSSSALFSLTDEPIQCQQCSNSFYVMYGREEDEDVMKDADSSSSSVGPKGGRVMARRKSSVMGQKKQLQQSQESTVDSISAPKKAEDMEDLIDKALQAKDVDEARDSSFESGKTLSSVPAPSEASSMPSIL